MRDCPSCGKHLLDCGNFSEYYYINRGCGFRIGKVKKLVAVSVYYQGKSHSAFVDVIEDADGKTRISTNDILRAVGLEGKIGMGEGFQVR